MIENLGSQEPAPILERRTVRVEEEEALRETIEEQGGTLEKEHRVEDTYFMQPGQEVLKLSIEDGTPYLIRLHQQDGKFDLVSRKEINDASRCRADLAEHYGIQQELTTTVRTYAYEPYTMSIIHLAGEGTFLTVQGEEVPDTVFSELGMSDPEFVTADLSQLSSS